MGHVDFKMVLGILGNIISIFFFASPIPTFVKIWKKKSVGDFSGVPYVATLLNCLLWVFYGLSWIKFQPLVVSINGLGAIASVIYIALYIMKAEQKLKEKVLIMSSAGMVGIMAVIVIVMACVPDDENLRKIIIGSLAAVFSVLMYSSPLIIIRTVIKTRSVQYMPFLLSLFNFLNGAVWTGYAFVGGIDIFIVIPNGLGTLLGVAQLILYAWYRNATPRVGAEESGQQRDVENGGQNIVDV